MARSKKNKAGDSKLEQQLVLLAWLNKQFNFNSNRDLLLWMRDISEGFDAEGRSYVYYGLVSRLSHTKISQTDLLRYDDNIRRHLNAINAQREQPITLRYFQHLALFYTEIILDSYFNRRNQLLQELNYFRSHRYEKVNPYQTHFTEGDLKRLAFWMATGSGKTLILHLNYHQFLHYNRHPLDNILLITPNEGLSKQHQRELTASNIPNRRFDLNESGLGLSQANPVRIIEITKLVEQKRGGGQRVPVEAFEGHNLIFVDEGHKGSGGQTWRSFREALGQTGFTFEYSATFGQALTAARNDALTGEYGKAIVFDYSYRYFHGDGYGKAFRILNLQQETTADKTELLLLGNLLSFYEQQRLFVSNHADLRPYNLEKPLWVFVGSSVNAVYSQNKQKRSDVLTVIRFLHRLLENNNNWAITAIEQLLNGETGLVNREGQDIFYERFGYLRQENLTTTTLYQSILERVLHTSTGGGLQVCDLRGSQGELALKASHAENYFGLIYIGDTTAFKKLVMADDSGITLTEDALTKSLFGSINQPNTTIEVLIGAKKFMEGWNSWRVASMGLLNIGRKEGSEIIQLFGRGVRLRGKARSLKRSAALSGDHPDNIDLLETLNIFAVRADYMAQFRAYLEAEGLDTSDEVELLLPIQINDDFLGQGLVVPRLPPDRHFAAEVNLLLDLDPTIQVQVDMSLKVQALASDTKELTETTVKTTHEGTIPAERLRLIDWEQVYLELLAYKKQKGWHNLVMDYDFPQRFFDHSEPTPLYHLRADNTVVSPTSFANRFLLHDAVMTILRKYVDAFYRRQQERWDTENMVYKSLDKNDANFQDYTIRVPSRETELMHAIQKLIIEGKRIYQQNCHDLPTIHFDRHLYQPLLLQTTGVKNKIRSQPLGLNKSEHQFVEDLLIFCRSNHNKILADTELYLLRNLSRGRGVGFFEKRGFYPDFILWLKEVGRQRIIFVEPHGMLHAEAYQHDEKARLHESLPTLAAAMGQRTGLSNVTLDSFIISATPFNVLRLRYDDGSWDRHRFSQAHILFPETNGDYHYIKRILEK